MYIHNIGQLFSLDDVVGCLITIMYRPEPLTKAIADLHGKSAHQSPSMTVMI